MADDRVTHDGDLPVVADEILYHIVSMALPRAAADAIDFARVRQQALKDGFDHAVARIEVSTFRAHGKTRITCRLIMALRVFVGLRDAKQVAESRGGADDARLAAELETAITAVLDAITAEMERPQSMSPAAGIGKMAGEPR